MILLSNQLLKFWDPPSRSKIWSTLRSSKPKVFDKDDKGISASELMEVMNHLLAKKNENKGQKVLEEDEISKEDAEALIKFYDHDEDNVLDFTEFAKILMEKTVRLGQNT